MRLSYATLMGRLAMPALFASELSPSLGALLNELGGPQLAVGALAVASALNVGLAGILRVMSGAWVEPSSHIRSAGRTQAS